MVSKLPTICKQTAVSPSAAEQTVLAESSETQHTGAAVVLEAGTCVQIVDTSHGDWWEVKLPPPSPSSPSSPSPAAKASTLTSKQFSSFDVANYSSFFFTFFSTVFSTVFIDHQL